MKNFLKFIFNSSVFYIFIPFIRFCYKLNVFSSRRTNNILIISLHHIGDVLFMTPSIKMLKKQHPEYKIDIWVKKASEPIVLNNPLINKVFVDNGKHTRINSFGTFLYRLRLNSKNILEMNKRNYDIIFDMSSCFESAMFTALLAKKKRYGIYVNKFFKTVYNDAVWGRDKPIHLKYHYCEVVQLAGIPFDESLCQYQLDIPDDIINRVKEKFINKESLLNIVIAPFAGWKNKEWDTSRFFDIAERFSSIGAVVFFIGAKGELERLKEFNDRFNNGIKNLMGKTSLLESAALIKKSDLFIGCDSSQAHIAEAFETKSIILFGSTNPQYSATPIDDRHVIIYKELSCSAIGSKQYCAEDHYHFQCPNNHECMNRISVDEVYNTAMRLLDLKKS